MLHSWKTYGASVPWVNHLDDDRDQCIAGPERLILIRFADPQKSQGTKQRSFHRDMTGARKVGLITRGQGQVVAARAASDSGFPAG